MMKRFAVVLLLGLLVQFFPTKFALADMSVTGTDNLTATVGVALPITDVQVSGATGTVPVKLLVTHGTLAFGSTTGLTFDGANSGAEIYFSGSQSDVNAALATLTYTRNSAGADELEVSLVEAGEVFFTDNGHLYEYIADEATWTEAEAAAELLTRYGATGYLATITSAQEQAFVAARLAGPGWFGASDVGSEGAWYWVTGPETGTQFWQGAGNGVAVDGMYSNWNDEEPNDSGSNEDCGQFLSGAGSDGKWNDLPCTGFSLPGYVVEFGAPENVPDTAGNSFTINTYAAPVLETISPADNATQVSRTTTLTLSFDQNVVVGSGNIRIVYANGGAVISTVSVTGGSVTGSGTDTITVTLPGSLPRSTEVAVQIDGTAFDAEAGGDYGGISGTTAWSFTTMGGGSVSPTPITNTDLVLSSVSCVDGRATMSASVHAKGAENYMLSTDEDFVHDVWRQMDGLMVQERWSLVPSDSGRMIYGLLKNTGGTLVRLNAKIPNVPSCVGSDDEEENDPSGDDGLSGFELIRGETQSAVYRYENGIRKPFYNSAIFFTWFTNFDAVKRISDAELALIPLGPQVLPKAGSLVKVPTVIDVYVVEETSRGYRLRLIEDEAAATLEFGADWAKRVLDIDVTLFKKFVR